MVVIKSMGGLGNQLFQYALYRNLLEKGKDVYCDLDWHYHPDNDFWYEYQLRDLGLIVKEIKREEYTVNKEKKNEKPNIGYYKETNFYHFDNKIMSMDDVFLSGYWQNLDYFNDVRELIKKEIVFPTSTVAMKRIEEQIITSNSVALHIRRNDYDMEDFDIVCSIDYYKKAIEFIKENVENPVFYIFTNKPEWINKNICFDIEYQLVDSNDRNKGLYDMKLISECKYNIISNSTFSWWGAFLNMNRNKIVVAPRNWNIKLHEDAKGLIPTEWVRI